MPDRAVVGERAKRLYVCPSCANCGVAIVNQPRALVALSEDRQWLVIQAKTVDGRSKWRFWKRDRQCLSYSLDTSIRYVEDTGQDAHEVLREFLDSK